MYKRIERIKPIFLGFIIFWWAFFPFDYNYFDWFTNALQYLPINALKLVDPNLQFETDTFGTYLLVLMSLLLGALCSPIIEKILKWKAIDINSALKIVLELILFYFLLSYGWNKMVKQQFYAPEPNTLYTPFGKLSKDIAYWSVIGSSYSYTFTLGIVEVLCALSLLFKRTKFLGSILGIMVFTQIVLINFSFDISVKLLSFSLLTFSVAYSLLYLDKWKVILGFSNFSKELPKHSASKIYWGLIVICCVDVVLPNVMSGQFNGDAAPKIAHYGAYDVIGSNSIKRVFVHNQGFLILENRQEEFADFKISYNKSGIIEVEDAPIKCLWSSKNASLIVAQDTFRIKRLPIEKLPILEEDLHLTSDQYH